MPPPLPTRTKDFTTRPIARFATAAAECREVGAAYGACIFADYNNVRKDMCAKEFEALKACFLKAAKKR